MKILDNTGLQYFWQKIKDLLSNKVDKVSGKGLSTNDYTTTEKTKLADIDANATAVGKNVTGTSYTIDGQTVVAKEGAEIFNDYSSNIASERYSHAEGMENTASGDCSHAEGVDNTASGDSSHAEGYMNTASGNYSHAEGAWNNASGETSHAEGYNVNASGNQSHAEGLFTTANGYCQHAQGKYNIPDSNNKYAFIIGNGTNNNNRSNAFAVDWNGLIYINNASTGINITELESRITALETTVNNINTILEEVL